MGTWNSSYEKDEACDWTEVLDALSKKENPGTGADHALFPVRKADGRTGTDEKS